MREGRKVGRESGFFRSHRMDELKFFKRQSEQLTHTTLATISSQARHSV